MMQLLLQLALNILPAVGAFVLGILLRRLRMVLVFFRARRFWHPIMTNDLQLVLGGFGELKGFEASGLVGRGDVLAMDELIAYFQKIGYGKPRVSYGDQLGRYDLTGDSLRTNMIIIGGPDANSLTRDMVDRIKLGIDFVETSIDEPNQGQQGDKARTRLSRRFGRVLGSQESHPWRIPAIRDLAEYQNQATPRIYVPSFKDGMVMVDYGVIIRAPNPFDFDKTVIVLCGSYGYGTWAAVRFAQSNTFLKELRQIPKEVRAIECVLGVDVVRESPQNLRMVFVRETPGSE